LSTTIRIGVVDDHQVVHDGVRAMTEREQDFEFCGGVTNSREALEAIPLWEPDVLLMDLRIGSEEGFQLCRRLREEGCSLGILIFSAFGNVELLTQGIRAGANGYVLKDTSTSRLPAIIREFTEVGTYFDPRIAGRMLMDTHGPQSGSASSNQAFSERELHIVRLIAQGQSNYDIAREVNLSSHTVKFHVTTMLRRFNVRRRAELVRVAMDRQLLP
jgi:two-component system response regulator DevR